jgi:hypothetical protein
VASTPTKTGRSPLFHDPITEKAQVQKIPREVDCAALAAKVRTPMNFSFIRLGHYGGRRLVGIDSNVQS